MSKLDGLDLLTNSRITSFDKCRYLHLAEYIYGFRRDEDAKPLRYGDRFHVGLDIHGKGGKPEEIAKWLYASYQDAYGRGDYDLMIECEQLLRQLYGYLWRWADDDYEVVASELQFQLPLINPKTGAKSRTFMLAGKIDKIIKLPDGRLAVMEHKTTSKSIKPDSDYWKVLRLNSQITMYYYAARELGYDVQTVVWDAIHKIGKTPEKAAPQEEIDSGDVYCKTGPRKGELKKGKRLEDEPVREYGDRMSVDIGERPEFYYQREQITRLDEDIELWKNETWQRGKSMQDAIKNGWHFRNTNSCTDPYRCHLLDVCESRSFERLADGQVPEGFVKLEWRHPELEFDYDDTGKSTAEPAAATAAATATETNDDAVDAGDPEERTGENDGNGGSAVGIPDGSGDDAGAVDPS